MILYGIKGVRPNGTLALWDGWYDDVLYDGCNLMEERVQDLQRAHPGIKFTIVTHECMALEDYIDAVNSRGAHRL